MDRVRAAFASIRTQMQGMAGATRGLLASLAVILLLVLGYVLLLTGQPDMVPLALSADTRPDVRARVTSFLQMRSIPYEQVGNELAVPADRQFEVLAQLYDGRVIQEDAIDFTPVFAEQSVFEPRSMAEKRYNAQVMKNVGRMIRLLDGVNQAEVIISPAPRNGGIGSARVPASATVVVDTGGQGMPRARAQAIARLVAHAHSGLDPANVAVTDMLSHRSYTGAEDPASVARTARLELEEGMEASLKAKIEPLVEHIPGARIAVNAVVDVDLVESVSTRFEEPKLGVRREQSRDFASTREPAGGEPGVRANVALSVGTTASTSTTESETDTRTDAFPPWGQERVRRTPGRVTEVSAVVMVPRSWLLGKWRLEQADAAADADEATLTAWADPLLRGIEQDVQSLLLTEPQGTGGTARVRMYDDMTARAANLLPAPEATGGLLADLVGGGVVSAASVVLLAMVSLGLMFMLVRSASRTDAMPSAEELVGIPPKLETDDEIIGEVGDEPFALEGKEVDEDVVRREQILEYLNNFAIEDSEEAAALLRRWLRDDEV